MGSRIVDLKICASLVSRIAVMMGAGVAGGKGAMLVATTMRKKCMASVFGVCLEHLGTVFALIGLHCAALGNFRL